MARKRPKRIHVDLNTLSMKGLKKLYAVLNDEYNTPNPDTDNKGKMELLLYATATIIVIKEREKEGQ